MARKKVADIVRADGSLERLPTTVAKMDFDVVQKIVGGYVERLKVKGVGDLWCNEEGQRMKLKTNPVASNYMGVYIVGDVIIETFEETDSFRTSGKSLALFTKTPKSGGQKTPTGEMLIE